MGDVDYIFRLNSKISVLQYELKKLHFCCNSLLQFLNEHEYSSNDKVHVLMDLIELYDLRMLILRKLKPLMLSRYQFLTHQM